MSQVQFQAHPARSTAVRQIRTTRLFRSFLIGFALLLLLSCIELIVIWIVNPYAIFSGDALHRLLALIALPFHLPWLLLIPLAEVVVLTLAVFLMMKPLALRAYLHDIRKESHQYSQLAPSLLPMHLMFNTPVTYYKHTPDPTTPVQGQSTLMLQTLTWPLATSLLIEGLSGAGKTLALQHCQNIALQQRSTLIRSQRDIPLYVYLPLYGLFIKNQQLLAAHTEDDAEGRTSMVREDAQTPSLLDFLFNADLPGLHHLYPYLPQWLAQGRLLLLCDGLDEVDPHYQVDVSSELSELISRTDNRFVITSRQGDGSTSSNYSIEQAQSAPESGSIVALLNAGHLERLVIDPLQHEQVIQFIEHRIKTQPGSGSAQYTAGQIFQIIDQSRLQYLCSNPLLLTFLLEIIDQVGLEEAKRLDTTGRLLQTYVTQVIEGPRARLSTANDTLDANEVLQLLSCIACAGRWLYEPYAVQLPLANRYANPQQYEAWASALQIWLQDHSARGLFATTQQQDVLFDSATIASSLQRAAQTGLIELHVGGMLSFRHALLADYFVAHYFFTSSPMPQSPVAPPIDDILANSQYWSMAVAIYATLLDTPMFLTEAFIQAVAWQPPPPQAATARTNTQQQFVQALTLCLLCIGVTWTPPRSARQQDTSLSKASTKILTEVMRDASTLEALAESFTACTQAGSWEIYHSLLPLLMLEGSEAFFVLLDPDRVLSLFFAYLRDAADLPAYEPQVKRLCRILWLFGAAAIDPAVQLSQPLPTNSLRLRSAAINILGGTHDEQAVPPLLERLSDPEKFIVDRSINALLRLGPELNLPPLLEELAHPTPKAAASKVHLAILTILTRYLAEKDSHKRLPLAQYQRVLDAIVHLLSSNYNTELNVQQYARELLIGLITGQLTITSSHPRISKDLATLASPSTHQPASGNVVAELAQPSLVIPSLASITSTTLVKSLASHDDLLVRNVTHVLEEAGANATPFLVEQLDQQLSEPVRVRLIGILQRVHDSQALPALLHLVADPSPLVQQQVTSALRTYSPASIPGLLDLVQTASSEQVAERAASILAHIGEPAVEPLIKALTPVVPGRTRLLVQVLAQVHDARALPPLLALLQAPSISQSDPLLVITLIRTLSQFATRAVVAPILNTLSYSQPQIYEEAIDALSSLGLVALEALLTALDVPHDTLATPRIRHALLGMQPFPGEALLAAVARGNDQQAHQIMLVLRLQGADAAHLLVQHLFDPNPRLQTFASATLSEMPGPIVVPALLEVLNRPKWRQGIATLLLTYPEAISPLVNLLGDAERAEAARDILPQFGPDILPSLVSALGDPRLGIQEAAQHIIVTLVRRQPAALDQVVDLFSTSLPLRAHEALLEVLTNDLADVSIPALLAGLADAHLINDVAEALVRLARKPDWQGTVLSGLLNALRNEERRRGTQSTLVKLGGVAVQPVGELITDPDQSVAQAAQQILRQIGAPALPFIWAAHGDTSNRLRRDAAMNVFYSMPTPAIKDALVALLQGNTPEDIAMAQALLLERMQSEAQRPLAQQEMIPSLIAYVQIHEREPVSLRIIALLVLLGGESVVSHLIDALYAHPDHHEQLTYIFLFLGIDAQQALLEILHDTQAPASLRAEAVSMLGLLGPAKEVYDFAQSLSSYGLTVNRTGVLNHDQLSIALRALGSLLTSGDWDVTTLQNLRKISQEGSAQHELYNVLLGWRYEPEITRMKNELHTEREARKNEIVSLTARIVQDQEQLHDLQEELDHVSHEHGLRADELHQVTQEHEALRQNLNQTTRDRDTYRANLEQALQEREAFRANLAQALQAQQDLQAEIAHLKSYNALLQQRLNQLRGA